MQQIKIKDIRTDGGTQPRAAIDQAIVDAYGEDLMDLPPVDVYYDGKHYWLADGFHRYHAHVLASVKTIAAIVHQGTQRDAVLHSLGANARHGLRRSNDDKRRAVTTMLRDDEWGDRTVWTDRKVAKACGVSQPFVSALRKELQGDNGYHPDKSTDGADCPAEGEADAGVIADSSGEMSDPMAVDGNEIDVEQDLAADLDPSELQTDGDGDDAARSDDGPAEMDSTPVAPPTPATTHRQAPEMKPEPLKKQQPAYMELTDALTPLCNQARQLVTEMERIAGRQKKRGEPDFTAEGTFYLSPQHFNNARKSFDCILDALPAAPKRGNPGYLCAAGARALDAGKRHVGEKKVSA